MKSAAYWKKRFEALEQAQHDRSAAYVRGRMRKQFEHAMAQIEKELTAWYTKTAENNEISMAGARRMLTAREQRELRWSLDEYRSKCKEYAAKYKLGTKDERLLQQLRNVTAKQAVTRLDALNLQLRMQLEDLYANHAGSMKEHLSDAYKESYYRTAYEIEKGTGIGAAFHEMETKRAEMVLAKPWVQDGKTFSNRIWQDKNKLVNTLQKKLPQQFVRGESLQRIVKNVAERMRVAQSSASRLVMTESAFFATAGERETMKALDVKQFEFVATLDDRTSEECRAMDGKHFPLKDLKVGENAPPLHCWCRSCIVPYFGDEKDGGRAARNPVKGKTEIVPAEMTYPEWKSVYVDKTKTLDDWLMNKGQKIPDGEYNLTIRRQVQSRHIDGTPEHEAYVKKLEPLGMKPSVLADDIVPKELINEFHGKGIYSPNPKDGSPREDVYTGRVIGQYWDKELKRMLDTFWCKIVYSKKGTHVYPIRPGSDNYELDRKDQAGNGNRESETPRKNHDE